MAALSADIEGVDASSDSATAGMNPVAKSGSIELENSTMCRICHSAENLISPCCCKGTIATVHEKCLERWLSQSGVGSCDLCKFEFDTETELRYTCLESCRIWASHPNTRFYFRFDLMLFIIISIFSGIILTLVILGIIELLEQQYADGDHVYWGSILFCVFGIVVVCLSIGNFIFLLTAQFRPWYNWWRGSKKVRIIFNKNPNPNPNRISNV